MCRLLAAGQPLPRAGSQAAPDPHWPKRGLKGREDGGNRKKSRFSYRKERVGFHMEPFIFTGGLLLTFKTHLFPSSDFPLI